jgi:hypothetical protein
MAVRTVEMSLATASSRFSWLMVIEVHLLDRRVGGLDLGQRVGERVEAGAVEGAATLDPHLAVELHSAPLAQRSSGGC